MSFTRFDPAKHQDLKLFEVRTRTVDDALESYYAPADVSHEEAAATPWYYVVKTASAKKEWRHRAQRLIIRFVRG